MEEGLIEVGTFFYKDAQTEITASGPAVLLKRLAIVVGAPNLGAYASLQTVPKPKKAE